MTTSRTVTGSPRSVRPDSDYHRLFALKAAREAARVLKLFEKACPGDDRPRRAIEAIRSWAEGERRLGMAEVRRLALDAHAAARSAPAEAAMFAARAAGQAVAAWHVPTHSLGAFAYAQKALCAASKVRADRRRG